MTVKSNRMTLASAIALVGGACIGSAVFSISGITLSYAGPAAILSWIIAALIYFAYGIVVVRLARRHPYSGGVFLFPKREFGGRKGAFLGFVSGWGYVISNIIAIAFSAICFGRYLHAGFPSVPDSPFISLALCAAVLLLMLSGVKLSRRIMNGIVILMVVTMLTYCFVAIFGGSFREMNFHHFFGGIKGDSGFISCIPLAMVAYGGCTAIAFLANDVRNPRRNVPLALFIGLGIVAILYCLTIFSLAGTVPVSIFEQHPELSLTPMLASVTHGSLSAYPWLTKLLSACISFALISTMMALMRVNAAALGAMAEEGLMPEILFRKNSVGVPVPAYISMMVPAMILCVTDLLTEHLVSLGALLNIATLLITCAALIKAERKSHLLAVAVVILFALCYAPELFDSNWDLLIFTAAVYLVGIVSFALFRRSSLPHLSGSVVHGKGEGHRHGVPTANLEPLPGEKIPVTGVWKSRIILEGKTYKSLTHIGPRPTVDTNAAETIETYILGIDRDLYGEEITLVFEEFLRPVKKFDSVEALCAQIQKDLKAIEG